MKCKAGQGGARKTRKETTPWVQARDIGGFKTQPHNYSTCLPLRGGLSVLSLLESRWALVWRE